MLSLSRGFFRAFALLLFVGSVGANAQFRISAPASISAPVKHSSKRDSLVSWEEKKAFFLARLTGDPYWQKRWWLAKTVHVLRGGRGLDANDNIDQLMSLKEEDIVRQLLADPRLSDMALDFNMAFLGFRQDRIRKPGTNTYDMGIFDFPAAITSAREVLNHGDYFHLFDLESPYYIGEAKVPRKSTDDGNKSDLQILQDRVQEFHKNYQTLTDWLKANPTATMKAACTEESKMVNDNTQVLIFMGVPISFLLTGIQLNLQWDLALQAMCFAPQGQSDRMLPILDRNLKLFDALFARMQDLVQRNYSPARVDQIEAIDLSSEGLNPKTLSYGIQQKTGLPNSSTNMNRKRAAYVLKHFFCDDLTPVGFEDPKDHTGGPHGSQTSCYACHYKLDPMAGFFRNFGVFFIDFKGQPQIVFDDLATSNLDTYTQNWKADPKTGREWNVGYVRTPKDERMNDYGDDISDLHSLFRTAPEVKSCLVKRLFEYVVSDEQTVDGSYLNYLTAGLTQRAAANSTDAFKWTVGQLVLSQSFQQQDPDPNQCYDFAPGYNPANAPPCRVAFILQNNCATCHSSTMGPGNLALNSWIMLPGWNANIPASR